MVLAFSCESIGTTPSALYVASTHSGFPYRKGSWTAAFKCSWVLFLETFTPRDSFESSPVGQPSLRTIARLIVLFLVCADLAEEKDGEVRLRHNGKQITVGRIYQKLVTAQIDDHY